MDTNIRLCIGGPLDRQLVEGTVNRLSCSDGTVDSWYNFQQLHGAEGRLFEVYVHNSISPDDALQRLLEVYAGKEFGRGQS